MSERVHLPIVGQLKEHVSFSELRLFNECGWKWVNTKVLGNAVEERALAMDFGKAVHAGMETMYGGDIPTAPEVAAAHCTEEFAKSLATLGELHVSDAKEAARLMALAPSFFSDVQKCPELQGIKTLRSELQLYEKIERTDGLDIKFKGFIDIIFVKRLKTKSVIYIADFKTCMWGWPAAKYRDIEVISQILLYKHFFCKLTGADPKNVTAAFILLKKTPPTTSKKGVVPITYEPSVEVVKIGAGPKAMQAAVDYLQKSITGMHSGTYTKNFEACRRSWIDRETKEERTSCCPFLDTKDCTGPAV